MRSPYIHCEDCDRLIRDPTGRLINGDIPCPECGARCAFRVWWPYRPDITALLELVHGHHILELAEQRVVASVFLATILEILFEVHLWGVLKRLGTCEKVAALLLDAHRGRERRIRLHNRLMHHSLREILESAGLPDFLTAWKKLAEARNETVHGEWKAGSDLNVETIIHIRDHCFDAFAAIREDARQTLGPGT